MTKISTSSDTGSPPTPGRAGGARDPLGAEQLASAFEEAPVALVFLGPQAQRLRVNQAFCRMFGYSEAELLAGAWPRTHPQDVGRDTTMRDQCVATGQPSFELEKRYLHRDGRVIWAVKRCTLVRDGAGVLQHFISQIEDITERKLGEQALRESEERFRSLTMLSSNWYWEQDEQARFTFFKGSERPGTWRPDEQQIIGRARWETGWLRPLNTTWAEHRAVIDARQPFYDLQCIRVRDRGRPVYLSSTGEPMFDQGGRFTGYRGTTRDITGEKRSAQHLRDAQALLQMAAQMGRLGGWAYQVGEPTVTWSDEVCAIYEAPPGFAPTPEQVVGFFAPDCQERIRQVMAMCLEQGGPFDVEARAITSRGRELWLRVIGEAEWDDQGRVVRIRGACQDITDTKQAADESRLMAEQLTTTLESLTDGFFTVDREWRITYANAEIQRMVRRHRAELIGHRLVDVFTDPSAATFYRHYKSALQRNEVVQAEEYYAPLDIWLHVKAYPSPQGLAVYVRDVTERVLGRRELLRLNAELEARVKRRTSQLELANRELEAFSYSIAHDLRAPLGAIDGFSECLERTSLQDLNERGRHYLNRIRAAVHQMQDLTEGLLALASLSRTSLHNKTVDLAPLAQAAFSACREQAPQRAADIHIAPSLPAFGDPRLLAQVMENLVGNAWKFTARRARARIEVGSMNGPGGCAVYYVRDNGAGFDPTYAAKLFEPFQRLHTQDEFSGTGIGLAIVHKVIARHGGRVWAESAPEQGATFFFTLE